ncbi:MAG: bifunctional 4-hydroxy-3-methylbut-2-enyl diphosphate reductase/30S ribosomal protein S1 [Clostridia bacterium]|nr:bifunctional 4-hydroxy-3-methylbut-2-enyl diphosphate reductase/30S ribosomal protein S1 [Clostridia bacterium]
MEKKILPQGAKVLLAENSGFCFGVRRAVDAVEKLIADGEKHIFTVGELIHNPTYLERLRARGVEICREEDILSTAERYPDAVFVIRAHGLPRAVSSMLEERGLRYVDATCPFVKKIHRIVESNSDEKTDTIIIGDKNHPEVEGIKSYAHGRVFICSDEKELAECCEIIGNDDQNCPIMVSQTTFNLKKYENYQKLIKKLYTKPKIFDTICSVTENRQNEAGKLAGISDVMLVLGAKQSSNSKKLYDICRDICKATYFAETAEDVPFAEIGRFYRDNFCGNFTAGITAGASTPDDIIEEVKIRMTNEMTINSDATAIETPEIKDTMTFEEMLNASYKSIRAGERVQGVITSVTNTEVHVDLGIKHTGIIPYSELSFDPNFKVEENFKVGDNIDVVVVKFNDAEGIVSLSKKRMDVDKNWNEIKDAFENGTILNGKVVEAVRGGVIFQAGPNRVFIPASHTTLPRSENAPAEEELTKLIGQEGRIKIIDTNDQRRRAVGSMRVVIREERKAAQAKFWETVEEGKNYTGTVKSLTAYGAFVDLGGVDGMVHITELSWKHIKHPSEVVKVGDTIDVFVKALDVEKKRISLGYKTEESNPWTIFTGKYAVEDIAEVKIVSLMPFGAFAEIVPGVDGLIHISQICEQKIQKPADVLSVGETVAAKITAIDEENKKVSLSIKALLAPEAAEEAVEEAVEAEEAETTEA